MIKDFIKRLRRPRHRRVEESSRPVMVLTNRDKQIIKAVNDHRALKQEHIQALFFSSRSTAQYRLQRLFQHEFLGRQFMSVVSHGPAASPAIYTLDKRGAKVLVEEFGYEQGNLRLPKGTFSWQLVEHTLKIADFRVAVTLSARDNGFSIEEWRDEATFRAHPDYVVLADKRGKQYRKPVLPDGYFCLLTPKGTSRFFIEVDRGTEELSKFTPQIRVYNWYTESGQYQRQFQAKSLRVLVITSSPKRLTTLREATQKSGGDRKYWFTTFAQATPEAVLTDPIWQTLEDDGLHSLISV